MLIFGPTPTLLASSHDSRASTEQQAKRCICAKSRHRHFLTKLKLCDNESEEDGVEQFEEELRAINLSLSGAAASSREGFA